MVVLSLPERIWTPDIVWEKDDSGSDRSISLVDGAEDGETLESPNAHAGGSALPFRNDTAGIDIDIDIPPPPPISSSDVRTPPALTAEELDPLAAPPPSIVAALSKRAGAGPSERKSRVKRQYFSKDECAICMESFEKGDVVRILPCGHVFHKDECDEWLLKWRKLVSAYTCKWSSAYEQLTLLHRSSAPPVAPTLHYQRDRVSRAAPSPQSRLLRRNRTATTLIIVVAITWVSVNRSARSGATYE